MIVNRYRYIEQLSRSKNNGLIKIITGLRRSGKSFLLKKLFRQHLLDEGVREDHILVIDMESRKNREFKNPDYLLDWVEKMMIDDETYYIIIDEYRGGRLCRDTLFLVGHRRGGCVCHRLQLAFLSSEW
jgi:predicted AAA+ superfamily ATPase